MRDLDPKSLRLLVAVCEAGNMRDAALEQHIEPSAVSKRIAQLEAALGVRLLHRGRHGATPTAAGQALLEHARTVLFSMDRMASDMAAFRGGVRGRVSVLASASAMAETLLDDLTQFMRDPAHAGIQVAIEERLSKDIVSAVRDGMATLGVCWDHVDFRGLSHQPYRRDHLTMAVPADHPLARLPAVRFEDTLDHEHVGLLPGSGVYSMLSRAAAQAGRQLEFRVVVSSFDAVFRVVASGLGISVVPREVSRVYLASGQVRLVPLLNDWAERRFALCHRKAPELPPAAQRLLEFLARQSSAS